jgi:2-polyprenyl-3-methyl-5-hydroxy-6-metoxy-1,4-benzoquinol methylase
MSARTFEQVPIGQVQEYWDRRPCNIRHSTKPPGSREYFDEVEQRKYFVEPHIPGFAEFPRWRDKRVLEIGCGIGTDTMNFARHGALVAAVDLSEKSLEMARKRAAVYNLAERIDFFHCSAEQLDHFVPSEPFDLVYSFGVVHHTPHPERILEQIKNYVRPGSTVKIMVYHRYSWKVFWILLTYGKCQFWRLTELVARYSEAETGCPVTYSYSKGELRNLMERNGFHVKQIWADHIFPYRIEGYKKYRYVKEWYFRWLPNRVFHALERLLGWHLCVTAEAVSGRL